MHPNVKQEGKGSCPICGMNLVEKKPASAGKTPGATVDAGALQRLGVRLATAQMTRLERKIKTYGIATMDETSIVTVNPKVDGWIKRLNANTVGKKIRSGDVLYEIYSPDLVQRQREYIELMLRRDQLSESMKDNITGQNAEVLASLARERWRAREKLLLADMDEETLKRIEEKKRPVEFTPVRARRGGVVTAVTAREGAYVTPMSPIVTIVDLSSVWVEVLLYRDQLEWARDGAEATASLPGSGKPVAQGKLRFVNPLMDPASQTLRARLEVNGAATGFTPGMNVDVRITAESRVALCVPRPAVIRDGRGARVMVSRGNGLFAPVQVRTGATDGENMEILEGLADGDRVAVNGQFLLDSAASMNEAAERMGHPHN
ncbi:MAG: efflux RND transporter periplasmic adaptor subunit [Nitrospinae bacterium]|nr:efflux RND transporter periplasmic adaptor subunit [Nitrospinota bacterium]